MVLIKYKNRKIYSQELKRYVNLSELIDQVKKGVDFSVQSYENGEDVTNEVLKQCLLNVNVNTHNLLDMIQKGSN